jgi:pyridoxine/pyridoxamine 5'-phosphate oxidase
VHQVVTTQLKTPSSQASTTANDPIALFQVWLEQAVASGLEEPTAMTVATVDADGYPDARLLLLKGVDERGFVFFKTWRARKRSRCCATRAQRSAFIGAARQAGSRTRARRRSE